MENLRYRTGWKGRWLSRLRRCWPRSCPIAGALRVLRDAGRRRRRHRTVALRPKQTCVGRPTLRLLRFLFCRRFLPPNRVHFGEIRLARGHALPGERREGRCDGPSPQRRAGPAGPDLGDAGSTRAARAPGRPGEEVPALGRFGDGFVWLHVNLNDARVPGLIAEGRLGPPDLAAAAFASDPHQRVTVEDGQVGGVIADLAGRPTGRTPRPSGCPTPPGGCISCWAPTSSSAGGGTRSSGPTRCGRSSPRAAARRAGGTSRNLDRPGRGGDRGAGRRLSDRLDGIEDHILDERIRQETRQLGPIRRDAVRLHRQLNGLRAVFHRLEERRATICRRKPGRPPPASPSGSTPLDRDMVVLAERSRLLQEELSGCSPGSRTASSPHPVDPDRPVPAAHPRHGLFGMNTKGLPLPSGTTARRWRS